MSDSIFSYREKLLRSSPEIEQEAKAVFRKILDELGIEDFNCTTKSDT